MEQSGRNIRIVLLGATGQIGSMVFDHLKKAFPNDDVIGCSRTAKGEGRMAFNAITDDYEALGKVDVIINCVGIIGETKHLTFENAHIDVVKNILMSRSKIGNPYFIHVSVLGADSSSRSMYASTKGVAEEMIALEENCAVIKPSFVLTPGTTMVDKVNMLVNMAKWQLGFLPMPAHFLTPKFQPVMGEDVAALISSLIDNPQEIVVHATGPQVIGMREMIGYSKRKIRIIPLPKFFMDPLFQIIIRVFPKIMNKDQYYLLAEDNTASEKPMEEIIGRAALNCEEFWKREII